MEMLQTTLQIVSALVETSVPVPDMNMLKMKDVFWLRHLLRKKLLECLSEALDVKAPLFQVAVRMQRSVALGKSWMCSASCFCPVNSL
ncbi:hypothetical protein VNO78_02704 [Psophocarpus tetragonolobus]|uniref:Uncharacterized protein n=1 Tax=Psophocarpus tetragonolobus TaxID=3891 RepID=A0AAN9XV96_PSOTE